MHLTAAAPRTRVLPRRTTHCTDSQAIHCSVVLSESSNDEFEERMVKSEAKEVINEIDKDGNKNEKAAI